MENKKRAAQGSGTVRKKTVTRSGKSYTYWEARVTIGRDPGTGKQIQKSFTGKTQREVVEKMQAASVAVTDGEYLEPSKLTVSQWLDTWASEYLNSVKPLTVNSYKMCIEQHIKPAIGATKLSALAPIDIQKLYNGLKNKKTGEALSPKSKKNVHGTLHKALEKAVSLGLIKHNPADKPDLPRVKRPEIKPLDDLQIKTFLETIKGHQYERLFIVTLFTGMREGEVLGLTWDSVDFKTGRIRIRKQLQKIDGAFQLVDTKNGKERSIIPAQFILQTLKEQQKAQMEKRLLAGSAWSNSLNLVFTNDIGGHLVPVTVYKSFKAVAEKAGVPSARFHDLRHSYAVAALRSGDDIKTVQEALGHYTAAFTLDTYAHVTEQMKIDSAAHMDSFIDGLKKKA